MKVWNVIHRSISTILVTVLALVLVSSYGAGNVVASYSTVVSGGDAVSVAKFNASIEKTQKSDVVEMDDAAAKEGICFPFTVTVASETSCVLDINVDLDYAPLGYDLFLIRPDGRDVSISPDYFSEDRKHWEFNGSKHTDWPEFFFEPSSEPTVEVYYLMFKESFPGSVNRYQMQDNIRVSAKIVQKD